MNARNERASAELRATTAGEPSYRHAGEIVVSVSC